MASVSAASADERRSKSDGDGGFQVGFKCQPRSSRLNEMAEDAPATSDTTAAGAPDDIRDPLAGSGPAVAVEDEREPAAQTNGASSSAQGHSRQHAAAETEDGASIAPSADCRDGEHADKQIPGQQPVPEAAREKLVLEKYTLYKTESVSRTHSQAREPPVAQPGTDRERHICSESTSSARIKGVDDTGYSR